MRFKLEDWLDEEMKKRVKAAADRSFEPEKYFGYEQRVRNLKSRNKKREEKK